MNPNKPADLERCEYCKRILCICDDWGMVIPEGIEVTADQAHAMLRGLADKKQSN